MDHIDPLPDRLVYGDTDVMRLPDTAIMWQPESRGLLERCGDGGMEVARCGRTDRGEDEDPVSQLDEALGEVVADTLPSAVPEGGKWWLIGAIIPIRRFLLASP